MDGFFIYVVALALLVSVSAFFSGSEAALFSLRRPQVSRLAEESFAGREIARLLSSPRRILVTILIGNLIVNVFATSAATSIAVRIFGDRGVALAFLVMSAVIMAFGEILPKVIAVNRPRRFSLLAVYPLRVLHIVFYPARFPITRLTDSVVDILKKRLGRARRFFSQEELITAFDVVRDQGLLGEFQYELLSNIIEFRDTTVKEIMTPSINVFSLPLNLGREDIEERIIGSEYSRVPVYGDTADDIRGIIHIKDLAIGSSDGSAFDLQNILSPPYYVPESTKISELFKELGRQRSHLAVVMDEYGSYVGIVTMEDVLEELVGEIRDSKEQLTELYSMVDDNRIIVLGTMEIDVFNEVFSAGIADDEHETIAGYVMGVTGRIPRAGETIDIANLRFHIISAQPNRIRKMRVERT
ncbi:MAG: hemolysin family protein [Candidatus Krumholzibacteria bacterium]|nr:hemolysin family protein [Candidatus Krumholzibacteria bacterium]